MDLSRDTLAHVARLARLRLDDDELEALRRDVEGILDHFENLADVDAEPAEAAAGPLRADDAARLDERGRAALLANVPRLESNRIRVERT